MCSLGALQKSTATLRPFFGNRVMEIGRIRDQIREMVLELPPVSHVPGDTNPADLGTRGEVSLGDLGPSSTWQTGPSFLRQDYESWPGSPETGAGVQQVPPEECKSETHAVFHVETSTDGSPVSAIIQEVGRPSELGQALSRMVVHALRREKLELATRALARCLQAVVSGRRESCEKNPPVGMLELAVKLMLRVASKSAIEALKDGKLRGLGAQEKNGVVWVSGRIRGDKLATLLGVEALPVILPCEPLALSVMGKAHREDHRRGPRDAAARSRKMVWVTSATRLAKSVVTACYTCRRRDKKMETQLMGQLPDERLEVVSPFEATALDLFGPFWVKDAAKGRRRFKCWVVAYVCMGAKAVVLLPCPGYGTEDFLTTHRFFTGIFGRPKIIYTDHAPSLVKAAETPDWGAIGDRIGGQGTEWRLTAKGCSWRNGLAERVIRAARHSLAQELRVGETLDFHQFGAILAVITAILNSRPLSLRVTPEGEFHSLAPRDVLFGRAGRTLNATSKALEFTLDAEQDIALQNMSNHQSRIVTAWRDRWVETVFPDMVARPKWRSASRNLREGDVGHVKYPRKVGEDDWRLAVVEEAKQDDDGVVRTVTVAFRPRHKRDTGKPYAAKNAQRMTIGAQRFAVLLAVEEVHDMASREAKAGEGAPNHDSEMRVN